MSTVRVHYNPIIHITVKNFLDSSSYKKLLDSLLPIRDNYLKILPSPSRNSKEKENEWDRLEAHRKGVMLHDVIKDNPSLNKDCIEILETNMGRGDLKRACEDTGDLLFKTHALAAKKGAMLFSQYETGGKMIWHSDHGPICSASYIFNFEDQDCFEGDFLLSGLEQSSRFPEKNSVSYPYEDNFLILFPAKALHSVRKVTGWRNSIQYFAGYEGWKVSDES